MKKLLRCLYFIQLSLCVILVASCRTVPEPTRPTSINQAQVEKLKRMPLPAKFTVPVHGVKAQQLKDTWGASRSSGRLHEGIDIMAPRGTKVLSSSDGVVYDLRNNNLGGKVIWIIGPAGTWHYYAHLDAHKRGLNVGDIVKVGDLLGYVGNTGNARHTAPHLHYGLYLQGKGRGATNPYPYLR